VAAVTPASTPRRTEIRTCTSTGTTTGGCTVTPLDPQIKDVLDAMAAEPQPDEPPTLEEVRAAKSAGHRALCPPAVEMASVDALAVPGPNGDVACLVSTPRRSDDPLPVLIYFHGGGLMLLSAEDFQPLCTALAAAADCIVVNVDYRLAPEHPFPQPLDDALAVYQWCLSHAADLGGDPTRVAVGGDSAGGYLATAVCLDARTQGLPQPVLQLLIYPDIDATNRSESMVTIDAFIGLDQVTMVHAAHCGDQLLDPRASPIHAPDHRGLAPAFILAASHDPFVDQGRAYAAVLRAAGVPVEYSCYQGTIHAFITMGGAVNVANSAVAEAAAAVAAAFGR
jgi:acetyl esterase/lipase